MKEVASAGRIPAPEQMKKKLIDYCKSINIDLTGIVAAEPFTDFEKAWRRQVERGFISGFEEKDIARRVNPFLTLESAKSIIVCLFPYFTGDACETPSNRINLSKSAWSIDYHIIVKQKLEMIALFLKQHIDNFEYKCFVDNGPFSDRYLAWRAGLGFWGINNCIITDRYGSYVFIGYIINNYPFEPDKPRERTCLQCFNCVKACPGSCIPGDFTINPQRCKSYITQKKGPLSPLDVEILKKTNLIWGCDVCQEVCPHNKNIERTSLAEFLRDLKFGFEYNELKQVSNREFLKLYRNRSFSWRGKGVLLRNYEIINEKCK